MKNTFIRFCIAILVLSFCRQAAAQTTIYSETFDATTTAPAGWHATANSWYLDTTNGNISSGYANATGGNNFAIKDTSARLGYDSLISPVINASAYGNITVEWGARVSKHYPDSGSTIALYWSSATTPWTPVTYTENTNNSNWALDNGGIAVALPAAAARQSALRFMWLADIHFTPSGTYRIDDLTVRGTSIAGISDISSDESLARVYITAANVIHIQALQPLTEALHAEIYDLSGSLVHQSATGNQNLDIDGSHFARGIYLVKVYTSAGVRITKVLVK